MFAILICIFFSLCQVVEVPNVSWEDIGGLENIKRELQEVMFLIPFQFYILGDSIHKFVISLWK